MNDCPRECECGCECDNAEPTSVLVPVLRPELLQVIRAVPGGDVPDDDDAGAIPVADAINASMSGLLLPLLPLNPAAAAAAVEVEPAADVCCNASPNPSSRPCINAECATSGSFGLSRIYDGVSRPKCVP